MGAVSSIILFFVSAALAVALGFFALSAEVALRCFALTAYAWMAGVLVLFLFYAGRSAKDFPLKISKKPQFLLAFLGIVGCSTYVICAEDWRFHVVMDEPILMATSYHFAKNASPALAKEGYRSGDDYVLLQKKSLVESIDKRPIFYPFLVSILHTLLGFKLENGCLLNNLLCPVFYLLLYAFLISWAHPILALCGLLGVTALPMLPWLFNGAGMEPLSFVFLLIVLLAAQAYLKQPSSQRLSLLSLAMLLLAQTRYEMVLFVLPVGLVILLGWRRRLVLSPVFILLPLLWLPYAWQQSVFRAQADVFQLSIAEDSGFEVHDKKAFSEKYVWPNLKETLGFFFDTQGVPPNNPPNSWALSIFGVCALLYFCFFIYKKRRSPFLSWPAQEHILLLFGLGVVCLFCLYTCYAWGRMNTGVTYRFSLLFSIAGVILGIWALQQLRFHAGAMSILVLGLSLLLCANTYMNRKYYAHRNPYFHCDAVYFILDCIQKTKQEHPLYLTDLFFLTLPQEVNTLTCRSVARNPSLFFAPRQQGVPIYAFQLGFYRNGRWSYCTPLEELGFPMQRLKSIKIHGRNPNVVHFFKMS